MNQITNDLDSNNDTCCGFVTKCYSNGYKQFCNLSQENHNLSAKHPPQMKVCHRFQKKNINNIIDQKYQEDIFTIYNFTLELISLLINRLISEFLNSESETVTIDFEDSQKLSEYDLKVQENEQYFRSNFMRQSKVKYYRYTGQ
jgi:hypothetical protein